MKKETTNKKEISVPKDESSEDEKKQDFEFLKCEVCGEKPAAVRRYLDKKVLCKKCTIAALMLIGSILIYYFVF